MKLTNPIHQAIYDSVVKPAMNSKTFEADGYVVGIDYYAQVIDVEWTESYSGKIGKAKRLNLPKENDGVFKQAPKIGDRVKVGFKNGNRAFPYVIMLYRADAHLEDFFSTKGASIPKGIGYL